MVNKKTNHDKKIKGMHLGERDALENINKN
jgi:hypothetical protein